MPAPNWQLSTLPVGGNWIGVEYGGGRFIAWQEVSNVGAYTDNRGTTWHSLTFPAYKITSVGYLNGIWFALSAKADGAENRLWKSTDGGITWEQG